MLIRARHVERDKFPPEVAEVAPVGQVHVTPGRTYEVQALTVFESLVWIQIEDDLGYPAWIPARYFEVLDPQVPDDWICNVMEGSQPIVLGPAFLAQSEETYRQMLELEPKQVEAFRDRIDKQRNRPE
jgi:hypothetical protein